LSPAISLTAGDKPPRYWLLIRQLSTDGRQLF
jgi:hypothetical protein